MTGALAEVAELVWRESGIRVRANQDQLLGAALARIDLAPEEVLRLAADPLRRGDVVLRLLDAVAVQETYFFRAQAELESIDWVGLSARAQEAGRDTVRVWNPACSSGAEAYTLMMLAADALGSDRPPVRILATDIVPRALARVAAARYNGRAVARIPPARRQRWLLPPSPEATTFEVVPELRACVEPRRHNLVRDPAPPRGEGRFDLIVCRNVLIYFEPDQVRRVVAGLERALAPGGTMVLGAADRLVAHVPGLTQAAARALPAARSARALRTTVDPNVS